MLNLVGNSDHFLALDVALFGRGSGGVLPQIHAENRLGRVHILGAFFSWAN